MEAAIISTPIGLIGLETVSGAAVSRIDLRPQGPVSAELPNGLLAEVARQLRAYCDRRLVVFDLPLAPNGTPFQTEVWSALRTIPYAATWSYGDLAKSIGRPSAVRAVGAANGQNPIPIVIPCHRVIGSDGRLVGFGGGLDMKRALLDIEREDLFGGGPRGGR